MKLNRKGFYFLGISIAIAAGFWLLQIHQNGINADKETRSLLAKRIYLENPDDILINFSPLRQQLNDYASKIGAKHSMYFEYLFTGTSIRVGENESMAGASLLKLPIVIDLYKADELGKVDLDKEVVIKEEWLNREFGKLWEKGAGAKITLREAAKLAMIDSDNTAINAITANLPSDEIGNEDDVINEIDISIDSTQEAALITARSYGSILKCLYFSCFLSKEHSQEILELLTQTNFNNQLTAELPKEIKVAHKIGTFSNKVQSDCGVVYLPKRPYVICIMIQEDAEKADSHIRAISKLVYDFVSSTSPEKD